MLIPLQTEVVFLRYPVANWILMGLCVLAWICFNLLELGMGLAEAMILEDGNLPGLFGHMFLHADFFHLFGNMIFLWVFGNAACEKLGNLPFCLLFIGAGLVGGLLHTFLIGGSMVGASGAVNGVVGAYLAMYPANRITCFWMFFFRWGTFQLPGYLLILFWTATDMFMAFRGAETGIAYWAHVGGFLYGLLFGLAILRRGGVAMGSWDNPTLLDILHLGPRRAPVPAPSEEVHFPCPRCGQTLIARSADFGSEIHCWNCREVLHLEEES